MKTVENNFYKMKEHKERLITLNRLQQWQDKMSQEQNFVENFTVNNHFIAV